MLKFMVATEDPFFCANVLLMSCCLDKRLNHKIYHLYRLFWCSVPPVVLLSVDTVPHDRSLGFIHLSESLWVYFKSIWNRCKNRAHKSQQVRNYSSWRTESEYLLTFKGNHAACNITNDPWNLSACCYSAQGNVAWFHQGEMLPPFPRPTHGFGTFVLYLEFFFPFKSTPTSSLLFFPCPPYHFHPPQHMAVCCQTTEFISCPQFVCGYRAVHFSMGNLSGSLFLKKVDFPYPCGLDGPIAPTWGLEPSWILPYLC